MEQLTWIFIGVVALLVSGVAVSVQSMPRHVAQVATGFSVFVWAYWAISATDVTITTSCCRMSRSYTGAMFLGLAAALVMLLLLFESVFEVFGLGDTGGPKNAT